MKPTTSRRANSKLLKGNIEALVTIIGWASSFSFTKVLMEDGGLSPAETYVYRFALAYLFLIPFTFRKFFADNWKDEIQLALCGLCSGTLFYMLENHALTMTSITNVSLLSALSPLFTAILMVIFYHQKFQKGLIIGTPLALVGVCFIVLAPGIALGLGLHISPAGDILAFSSALSWAIYSVAVKRLIPLYTTLFITRKMFFYGVLGAIPFMMLEGGPVHFQVLIDLHQPQYLLNLLFLVLICSLMCYVFWNEAIKNIGPVKANNYIYSQPIFGMLVGALWLGEPIYPLSIVGTVLIVGGLIVSDKIN